jgi:serine/threonine protein kinase
MFNYGVCLLWGQGVSVDRASAARYFEAAAEEGQVEGLVNFGFCLHNGIGIERNVLKSARYFKAAADRHHAVGEFNYGVCCYRGEGNPVDFTAAVKYFRLSSNHHYGPAHLAFSNCMACGQAALVMFQASLLYPHQLTEPSCYRWDDVRPINQPILVNSFTPVIDLPSCQIEIARRETVAVFANSIANVYRDWKRWKQVMLDPDFGQADDFSDFEVDIDSLKEVTVLGSGGSGKVKLMIGGGSAKYAVKYCTLCNNSNLKSEIFRREFEVMCRLHDPCVVPCYGFWMGPDENGSRTAVLIMKYMENGSVRDVPRLAKSGKAPSYWDSTGKAIIVCGLEFIHSQGVVYQDIKPANLLLDRRGYCQIGDFGSSRFILLGCRLSQDVSTLDIQAPEQSEGLKYTNKVDVFSFGVVLHEILRGSWDGSVKGILRVMEGYRPGFPACMNEDMQALITRCWAQNSDAHPSFRDILTELKGIGFKILANVDCGRVRRFVSDIETQRAMGLSNASHTRERSLVFKKAIAGNRSNRRDTNLTPEYGRNVIAQSQRLAVSSHFVWAPELLLSSCVSPIANRFSQASEIRILRRPQVIRITEFEAADLERQTSDHRFAAFVMA